METWVQDQTPPDGAGVSPSPRSLPAGALTLPPPRLSQPQGPIGTSGPPSEGGALDRIKEMFQGPGTRSAFLVGRPRPLARSVC